MPPAISLFSDPSYVDASGELINTRTSIENLGYEVINFDSFSRLTGSSVVSSPAFRDNLLAFGASYGLCLQGLGESSLKTNLVPREIIVQRLIREKKPWALACVAALLLACSFNFFTGPVLHQF